MIPIQSSELPGYKLPEEPLSGKQNVGLFRDGARRAARHALRLLNPLFYLKQAGAVGKYAAIGGIVASCGGAFLYSDGAAVRLVAESAVRYTASARQFVRELGEPNPALLLDDAHEHLTDLSRMVSAYRTEIEAGKYDAELAALEKSYDTLHETFYQSLSNPTLADVAGIQVRECTERAKSVVDAAKVRADARLLASACSAQEKKLAEVIVEAEKFDTVVDADPDTAGALIEKLRSTFAESRKCVQAASSVLGVADASADASAPEPAKTVQPVVQRVETAESVLSCFSAVLQKYLSRIEPEDAYRSVIDPVVHLLRSQYSADALAARNTTIALETIPLLPEEGVYEVLRRAENRLPSDAKVQRFREYADDVAGLPRDARRDAIDYLVQRECRVAPERCSLLAESPLALATPEQATSLIAAYAQKLDPVGQQALYAHLAEVQRTLAVNGAAAPTGTPAYSSSSRYVPAAPPVSVQGNSSLNPLDFEDQPRCHESENRRCIPNSELEKPGLFQRIANKVSTLL